MTLCNRPVCRVPVELHSANLSALGKEPVSGSVQEIFNRKRGALLKIRQDFNKSSTDAYVHVDQFTANDIQKDASSHLTVVSTKFIYVCIDSTLREFRQRRAYILPLCLFGMPIKEPPYQELSTSVDQRAVTCLWETRCDPSVHGAEELPRPPGKSTVADADTQHHTTRSTDDAGTCTAASTNISSYSPQRHFGSHEPRPGDKLRHRHARSAAPARRQTARSAIFFIAKTVMW